MRPLSARLPHGAVGKNLSTNISLDPIDRYLDSVSIFTRLNKQSLYSTAFSEQIEPGNSVSRLFSELSAKVKTGSAVDRLLYIDSKTYLPGDIMTKVDRMSMAVSLEARAPLLDHKLIDFVTRIPASLKLHNGETKHIMKRAVTVSFQMKCFNRPKAGIWCSDPGMDQSTAKGTHG
jgi:asparagine synthase (glutamine-hydrolysing)